MAMRTGAGTVAACRRPRAGTGAAARNALVRARSRRDYGRRRRLDVAGRRLARATSAGSQIDGRAVNVIDTGGDGAAAACSSTASSGSWQNWLREHPRVRATAPRASRWTCPASARRRCRREEISISGYARGRRRAAATQLGIDARRRSSATRWAASSAPSWRSRFPTRVEQLVLVSAAGLCDRAPARRAAARWRSGACWPSARRAGGRRSSDALRAPPAAAPALLRLVLRYPERLSGAAGRRAACAAPASRASSPALDALTRLPDPRPARRDRVPDADRLGRATTCSIPVARRRRASSG